MQRYQHSIPTTKLNLWVCTIGGGTLGYAQFPGASSTDGVAIDSKYIEILERLSLQLRKNSYSRSRTLDELTPHLGDANCGSDLVSDTPTHNTNYGVPAYITALVQVTIEMTMNYMDYTDDRGMFMFSNKCQKK
jgi:hypothetical protein